MTSSLRKQLLSKGISALPPIPDGNGATGDAKKARLPVGGRRGARDYSPLAWDVFFSGKSDVSCGNCCFNVYTAGDCGPLFVLLHGGGYSGLSWSCFARDITDILHCRVLAPDLRGHGDTSTDDDADMSIGTMANDVRNIITGYLESIQHDDVPGVILVGHSMGGAVAVHAAALLDPAMVLGLVVIDVVEGSAMDALYSMQSFLRGRPTGFKSVEHGIEWCLRSGQTRNLEAARVSFPSQLRPVRAATVSGDGDDVDESTSSVAGAGEPASAPLNKFEWRIDLMQTEPFWKSWFEGLSAKFLSIPAPKTLILAGVDRLDRDLTVGQMQGKFQMIVLPKVGHAVHEDSPMRVAEALATFCVRHQLTTSKQEFKMVFPGC